MSVALLVAFANVSGCAGSRPARSTTGPESAAAAGPRRTISDGLLSVRNPVDWSGVIGPGVVTGTPAAYILVADFRLRDDAAMHEGGPTVPAGKVVVSIGDFPIVGRYRNWPRVAHLKFSSDRSKVDYQEVRFRGRAVSIGIRFGSHSRTEKRELVNRILASTTVG
jgi:hypothetical protein